MPDSHQNRTASFFPPSHHLQFPQAIPLQFPLPELERIHHPHRGRLPSFLLLVNPAFFTTNLLNIQTIPPNQCYAHQVMDLILYYDYFFYSLYILHKKCSVVWSTNFFHFIPPMSWIWIMSFLPGFRPLGSFVHLWAFIPINPNLKF